MLYLSRFRKWNQLLCPTWWGMQAQTIFNIYNISALFCDVLAFDNILFYYQKQEYYNSFSIINNFEIQKIDVPF